MLLVVPDKSVLLRTGCLPGGPGVCKVWWRVLRQECCRLHNHQQGQLRYVPARGLVTLSELAVAAKSLGDADSHPRATHCAANFTSALDTACVLLYVCHTGSMSDRYTSGEGHEVLPFLSKLESLAGSAVRAAGKVEADLIVVYTATGQQGLTCDLAQVGVGAGLGPMVGVSEGDAVGAQQKLYSLACVGRSGDV